MDKKIAFGIVLQELTKCDLFCGKYDAKNGNESFMNGVGCVMEFIAGFINDETYEAFSDMFLHNLLASEDKAKVISCSDVECSGHCYSCAAAAL